MHQTFADRHAVSRYPDLRFSGRLPEAKDQYPRERGANCWAHVRVRRHRDQRRQPLRMPLDEHLTSSITLFVTAGNTSTIAVPTIAHESVPSASHG